MTDADENIETSTTLDIRADKKVLSSPVTEINGNLYMLIPVHCQDHLDLAATDPAAIRVMAEDGPHGPYLSVWNQRQQTEEERTEEDN